MSDPIRETTRWHLAISKETDLAVRTFLARSGTKRGDLSRFVEEAVRWRVFDRTLAEAREGLSAIDPDEAQAILDEALAQVRADLLAEGRLEGTHSRRR